MPATQSLTAVERDKIEIDPNFDFKKLASVDFDDIQPNVMAMFKWCGVYSQLQKGFFMIRVVTPGGLMSTTQFAKALELADEYGQGELCITTRQTLQFHWIRLPDIHKVLEGMLEVGITTKNGCGDVTRNTVTCPLQGVCPNEIGNDVRRLITAIATDPEIQDQQRNLPRKHKISVAGCAKACSETIMNCQGWIPAERKQAEGSSEIGWTFHAGGGLGARPYLGKVIFDWVPCELALDVARATVEAFRRHGDRRNRGLARLKIVVDRMGPAAFGALLIDILKERGVNGLDQIELSADPAPRIEPAFLNGQGVVPQKQEGLSTVRVMIPRSEIRTEVGREICRLADTYGDGAITFTSRQNLTIRNIPHAKVDALSTALHKVGCRTDGFERIPDIVACVGSTQCKMAVSDTPKLYHDLKGAIEADADYWEKVGPLRINLTGCPNNCAHAWIADIGLRGRRRRTAEGNVEGFSIFVGGKLSEDGHIAHHLMDLDADAVPATLHRIFDLYLAERKSPEETFCHYTERTPVDALRNKLSIAEEAHA